MSVPAFLLRFAATASALWYGRAVAGEGWALYRRLDVVRFTDEQLRQLAQFTYQARGLS